ncbi:UNVERIFIED_CONTAM: MAC/perforin domain-containing protein, partial [Prevotella sp. 15_C9]
DGMTAGGALEFKLKVSIGIDVKGEGDYSQDQKNILEKTEAKVNIRGGNVNEVCILATGGVLENEQVLSWQQSVEPSTAVMIDMKLVPIYLLINDQTAH